ncbi:neutral/alkaline non-lysosomal ceramidase N-terminal domain-containing protein [candidate division KSB1 bacterium]|nr:neutral/alkaline non-lysosomal ceramidase N-terminal domain-containing protein [candidate division KSB1 bacterium]
MKTGFAKVDITPPIGIELTGYAVRQGVIESINDPLFAKAIVFDDDKQRAALIVCDLLGLDADFVQTCRRRIENDTGIPGSNIMIACTHTHSGPATIELVECGEINAPYMSELQTKICDSAVHAWQKREPSRIGIGRGEAQIGIDRRAGLVSDECEEPANCIDSELLALKFVNKHQALTGVVANYGCHGTSIDPLLMAVSADFMGIGMSQVERAFEDEIVAIFTSGGGGDVNPHPRCDGYQNALIHGKQLSEQVLKILKSVDCAGVDTLFVDSILLELSFNHLPTTDEIDAEIHRVEATIASFASNGKSTAAPKSRYDMRVWLHRVKHQIACNLLPRKLAIEIQVICFGGIACVGLPFEVFSSTAHQIKRASPFPNTIVISQANGNYGYLPPEAAIRNGGYEVDTAYKYYGYPSGFSTQSEDLVRQTAIKLLNKLRQQ